MTRVEEQRLGDIVGRLYEVALDPETLHETGACLREALDVGSSIMFVCDATSGELRHLVGTSQNFDAKALSDYRAHYHEVNPWFHRGRLRSNSTTVLGEELIGLDDFRRTEFAADFARRVDIQHTMGSIRQIAPGLVVGTGVHRTARQGAFDARDLRLYRWLADHLGRALQVAIRFSVLEGQRLASLDALHAIGVGVALLDESARPVFLNAVSERLVRESRWLTVAAGRLQPVQRTSRRGFTLAVEAAAQTAGVYEPGAGRLLRLSDPVEGALPVTVAPFRTPAIAFDPGRPVALVQFTDPDRPPGPRAAALAMAYDLSPAEARLTEALIGGKTLPEHARDRHVSVNTARTLLARVFAKTGTKRQQDLLVKVISELAPGA